MKRFIVLGVLTSQRVIKMRNDAATILAPPTLDIMQQTLVSLEEEIFNPTPVASVRAANGAAKPVAKESNLIVIE